MGQQVANGTCKATVAQVAAATTDRIKNNSHRLAIGDYHPGDGYGTAILDCDLIDKGRANRHCRRAGFGERHIAHG